MKPCSKCLIVKSLEEFGIEKRVADGRQSRCRECAKAHRRLYKETHPSADREYYLLNKEVLLAKKREKYKTNDIHRQKALELARKYKQKNHKKILEQAKAYGEANADKIREYQKRYRSKPENIERANARSRKYRANPANLQALAHRTMQYNYRKLNATGMSTKTQLKARWDYYGGLCWICLQPAREMDHVKPLTKGGSHWPGNLRPICRPCNARKSNIWPLRSTKWLI